MESDVAELVQANFRAVGIDCSLENEEIETFFSDELASNFQLSLRGIILPPYPDDYKYYHSAQTRARGGSNEGFTAIPRSIAPLRPLEVPLRRASHAPR